MTRRGHLRIGTSGYQYDHWRGRLYPEDLPKTRWFEQYTRVFDTVELNSTFYRLPGPETFQKWRRAAPPGFCYAVKYSRFGTHLKHLKNPQSHVRRFVDHTRPLGNRLGPTLVQLPPDWHVDLERLRSFLAELPGRRRWALEVRDASWLCEDVLAALRAHGVALCLHDLLDDHPRELTADWTYLRFHGPDSRNPYAHTYPHQALTAQAARIHRWLDRGYDVYAYFNNDQKGYAVQDARDLRRFVESRR